MNTAFERRVQRLRQHVLSHNAVGSESIEDLEKVKELSIGEMTKDDIIKRLEEQGIEHNPRDKKEVLFDLLVGE